MQRAAEEIDHGLQQEEPRSPAPEALHTLGANTDAARRQPNIQDPDGVPSFPPLSTVQLAPDLPS